MMEGVRVQVHWDLSIADLLVRATKFLLAVDYTLNGDQMTQTIIPDSKLALIRNESIKTYNYQNSTKAFQSIMLNIILLFSKHYHFILTYHIFILQNNLSIEKIVSCWIKQSEYIIDTGVITLSYVVNANRFLLFFFTIYVLNDNAMIIIKSN